MTAKEAYAQLKELAAGRYCSLSVEVCGGGKVEEKTRFLAYIQRGSGGASAAGMTLADAIQRLETRLNGEPPPVVGIASMDEFKEVLS